MAIGNSKYLLAIESAISGGSVALFRENELISHASGDGSVSRAEDLLPSIEQLFNTAGLKRSSLDRIAVSVGPGSYTGLRIGIATVMGLSRGLRVEYVGVPLFDAIASFFPDRAALIALPMGRTDVCLSEAGSLTARVVTRDEMKRDVAKDRLRRILVHSDLVDGLADIRPDVVDIGSNLAQFVGTAAIELPASTTLEPIYIQNPRFC